MKYALIALLFLTSCSPNWFCKKCLDKGIVKTDTVRVDSLIFIPLVETDTVVRNVPGETVTLTKDRLTVKVVTKKDSIWIYGQCAKDSIRIEVPVLIETTIETGWRPIKVLGIGFLILILLLGILRIVKFI